MLKIFVSLVIIAIVALMIVESVPRVAEALEIQYGQPCQVFDVISGIGYQPSDSNILALPYAYTVWSKDSADFYVLIWQDGVANTNAIYIPAGRSFTFPAPPAYAVGSNFRQKMTFHAQTDTIYLIPWVK